MLKPAFAGRQAGSAQREPPKDSSSPFGGVSNY